MSISCFHKLVLAVVMFLLGIFMGVTNAAHAHSGGGGQPISRLESRSICASLCLAGLGGEPCGAPCATLTPRNATQSGGGSAPIDTSMGRGGKTRRDACPLLCKYQLGSPLCDCGDSGIRSSGAIRGDRHVDYNRICNYFCSEHDYHIYGCPECKVYKKQDLDRRVRPTEMDIDWEQWCREQCAVGLGGVACDCDLPLPLPMNLIIPDIDTDKEGSGSEV